MAGRPVDEARSRPGRPAWLAVLAVAALLGFVGCQPRAETIKVGVPSSTELPGSVPRSEDASPETVPTRGSFAVSSAVPPTTPAAPPTTLAAPPAAVVTAPSTTRARPAPVSAAPVTQATVPQTAPPSCPNGTYTNVNGNRVCSPYASPSGPPPGATAQCSDGTYSMSQHRQGTCSGHGGVARFL